MHILRLLTFVLISRMLHANQDRANVAWVPIQTRNISEVVGKILDGNDERLQRIGKMLTDSYDKMARDTEEGQMKIRELEQSNSTYRMQKILITAFTTLYLGMIY